MDPWRRGEEAKWWSPFRLDRRTATLAVVVVGICGCLFECAALQRRDSEMVLPQHTSRNEQRCSGELCLLPSPSAYSIREARKEGGPLQTSARDRWWIIPLCALSLGAASLVRLASLGPRCQNQNDRMEERSERRRSKQPPPPRPRQPTAPRGPRAREGGATEFR